MRLTLVHARASTVELARHPAYVVPTLVFPAAFFLVFAAPGPPAFATLKMTAFAGFAAIGVAFFQFGVGIAVERSTPWETYLRTLPIGASTRLAARVLSATAFALAASATLVAVALVSTDASLSATRWAALPVVLLGGTVPFALLGIALGYWAPQRGALPLANLLYLGLSYGGGLWIRPQDLPLAVARVSPYLPTRALEDVLAAVPAGNPFASSGWLSLAAFTAAFALVAAWGYRRDEGKRFR